MKQNLTLKGIAAQYFIEAQESNSPWNGLDDIVDDAVQAVLLNNDNERKLVVVNIERNKIEVFDNGIGQTYDSLNKAYSNAVFHNWERNVGVGIKGLGRFKFAAICSDFSSPTGSSYIIQSSVGDNIITEIEMKICKYDSVLLTPTINDIQNSERCNNGINIFNGKLKGTIVSLSPACINDTDFTPTMEIYYGHRYHDNIKYDNVELIINGKKIEPFDLPHISHITDDKINSVIYDEENKFCSIYHNIDFYHKLNKSKKFNFKVKATTSLYSKVLKNKFPWENQFNFNKLSGVYAKFRGRYLSNGGNVGAMFKQDIDSGDTKGKGKYGDLSGSYTAYNRTVLEFSDDEVAEIFGVKTVKSQGIDNLSDNKKLMTEYVTEINGEEVSVYNAICYIRYFLHYYVYDKIIKQYKLNKIDEQDSKWKSFNSFCQYYYNNFDFSKGELKKGKKSTSINDIEQIFNINQKVSQEKTYEINNKNCFIKAKWNDESVLSLEINDECDLINIINDDNISRIVFKEFEEDFNVFIKICKFTDKDALRFFIGKTKIKTNKYKKLFNK